MSRSCFRPSDVVPGEPRRTTRSLGLASPHPGIALASRDLAFKNQIGDQAPAGDGPFDSVAFQQPPAAGKDGTTITSIVVKNVIFPWSNSMYTVACDGRTVKIVRVETVS